VQTRAHAFDAGRCAQNLMLAAWNDGIGSRPAPPPQARAAPPPALPPATSRVLMAAFLLAGCAAGQACEGRTGGWLSSWGNTRGGNTVTVGLQRAWWDCQDRTLTPTTPQGPLPLAPSTDPMPDVPSEPSATTPPR